MKSNTLLFTQGFIDRLESAGKKRIKYWDSKITGLVLEVMPSGSKIYRYCRTIKFKQQWSTIGHHPRVTLEQARDAAVVLSAQLIQGDDFAAARQAAKDELTLNYLAQLYFDQYAKDRCISFNQMKKEFGIWWSEEALLPVSQLTAKDIQSRMNQIASRGRYRTANRALTLIKAIVNWGMRKNIVQLSKNPASVVDKFKEVSRERFVQPHEFAPLLEAISNYSDKRMRDFFLLCLYTGARSGNVKAMKWEQVDLDLGTWRIPETKNGDSQTIQLSESALSILKARYKNRELNPWVFPGGRHTKTASHMQEPKKGWKAIITKAGIKDLHIHDLRRTLASFMVMTGASTPIVQKQLGHKSLAAASIYQKVNNSPVKIAADQAIKVMKHYAEEKTVNKLKQIKESKYGRQ